MELYIRVRMHGGMCIPVHAIMASQTDNGNKEQRCRLHLYCMYATNKEDLKLSAVS